MNVFTQHPAANSMTYREHCAFALRIGSQLFVAGFACMVHAIFPFVFETMASDTIKKVSQSIEDAHNKDFSEKTTQ